MTLGSPVSQAGFGAMPPKLLDPDEGEFVLALVRHKLADTPDSLPGLPRLDISCRPGRRYWIGRDMSLEDLLIAHSVVSCLLPDELAALADLLERLPLPAPGGCIVPLAEFRRLVAAEFGEECPAVRQLDSLIL